MRKAVTSSDEPKKEIKEEQQKEIKKAPKK